VAEESFAPWEMKYGSAGNVTSFLLPMTVVLFGKDTRKLKEFLTYRM
jgi:hypothetical protein